MKTTDHRRAIEELLAAVHRQDAYTSPATPLLLAEAQVHATLARNEDDAATRADMRDANTLLRRQIADIKRLLDDHIAEGLASNDPYTWHRAQELSRDLDGAGLNIDDAIDERLNLRGIDPTWAWKHPTRRLCRDGHTWIDLAGQAHDLNKAYIDQDGTRWTWTKKVDDHDGYPIFTSGKDRAVSTLDTLVVFGAKPEDGGR